MRKRTRQTVPIKMTLRVRMTFAATNRIHDGQTLSSVWQLVQSLDAPRLIKRMPPFHQGKLFCIDRCNRRSGGSAERRKLKHGTIAALYRVAATVPGINARS